MTSSSEYLVVVVSNIYGRWQHIVVSISFLLLVNESHIYQCVHGYKGVDGKQNPLCGVDIWLKWILPVTSMSNVNERSARYDCCLSGVGPEL
jgi:hypothetical protein